MRRSEERGNEKGGEEGEDEYGQTVGIGFPFGVFVTDTQFGGATQESDALDEGDILEGFGKIIEDVSGAAKNARDATEYVSDTAKDMERIMRKKRREFLSQPSKTPPPDGEFELLQNQGEWKRKKSVSKRKSYAFPSYDYTISSCLQLLQHKIFGMIVVFFTTDSMSKLTASRLTQIKFAAFLRKEGL